MKDTVRGQPVTRVELFNNGVLAAPDGRPVQAVSEYSFASPPADGRPLWACSTALDEGQPKIAMSIYTQGTMKAPDGRPVYAIAGCDALGAPVTIGVNYSGYVLALDFDNPEYWVAGVKQASLAAVPGYSFSRAGEQGAVDASGAVQWFAANVPAINSNGYHAYTALTNLLGRSQELDNGAWTKNSAVVTADAAAAPDGTNTMDLVVPSAANVAHGLYQLTGADTGGTVSVFAKMSGHRYIFGRLYDGAASKATIVFDLQTGTVGAVTTGGAAFSGVAGYIVNCGGGLYRCVFTYTRASGTTYIGVNFSDVANPATDVAGDYSYLAGGVNGAYLWQLQKVDGNFPDGGPLIRTAGATASIAASALVTTANPITADQDFIWWGVCDVESGDTDYRLFSTMGASAHYIGRNLAGVNLIANVGGAAAYTGGAVTNGRMVVLLRRRAGKNTLAYKQPDGTVALNAESGVTGFTVPTTTLQIGLFNTVSNQPQGAIKGVFIQTGTFSDAQLAALLNAA